MLQLLILPRISKGNFLIKSAVWGICGIATGAVFVLVTGIFTIQALGLAAGGQYDLDNSLAFFTPPRVPILMMCALAVLSAVVIFVLTVAMRNCSKISRMTFTSGFSVATLLLVILSFAFAATGRTPETPMIGVAPGWQGWLNHGGSSSAVHLVLLLAVGSLWMHSRSPQRTPHDATVSTTKPINIPLRSAVWGIYGMLLGVVFVFIIGMLSAQVVARKLGVILDLNNMVTAIASSTVAFLPITAIAVLSALVMFLLTGAVKNRARRFRVALVAGFGFATILLLSSSFVLAPLRGPKVGASIGIEPGWVGWLAEGSTNPAVHVVLLLAVGSLWLYSNSPKPTPNHDPLQPPKPDSELLRELHDRG
jgi:hypothetical protein